MKLTGSPGERIKRLTNGTGLHLGVRDLITIGSMLVLITASYFSGQAQAEKRAREIAREEVASAVAAELPTIRWRLGQIEAGQEYMQQTLEDIRERLP